MLFFHIDYFEYRLVDLLNSSYISTHPPFILLLIHAATSINQSIVVVSSDEYSP